jgi:hypothetical protein
MDSQTTVLEGWNVEVGEKCRRFNRSISPIELSAEVSHPFNSLKLALIPVTLATIRPRGETETDWESQYILN